MSTEANKEMIRRQIEEVWNQHNASKIADFWGDETLAQITHTHEELITAFPDTHLTIDDLLAEGDKVVLRATISGTHEGALHGIPPTHKQVQFMAMRIFRIADGKIVETHVVADTLGVLQQLGIVPTPGQS